MKVSPMTTETLEQAADRIAEKVYQQYLLNSYPSVRREEIKAALLEYGNLVGAEIERLRKDAARYNWWVERFTGTDEQMDEINDAFHRGADSKEEAGALIDAAMAQVKEKA